MNTNDNLLVRMIERDMQNKGISEYEMYDSVESKPSIIPVSANEVIYVFYVKLNVRSRFELKLLSGTRVVKYSTENTIGRYESNHITSHWSTIKISIDRIRIPNYIIRYVRVIFKPKSK